jgi:hypothetical protein
MYVYLYMYVVYVYVLHMYAVVTCIISGTNLHSPLYYTDA